MPFTVFFLGEGSSTKIDKTEKTKENKRLVPTYSNLSTGGPSRDAHVASREGIQSGSVSASMAPCGLQEAQES